jgi:hypothetical protein
MPTEVLSLILSNDCLEVADLYQLSVANKILMQAVQPKLYSHIALLSDQPMAVERLSGVQMEMSICYHFFVISNSDRLLLPNGLPYLKA